MITKLNSGNHCVYSLHYHLVLVTKFRRKCINTELMEALRLSFTETLNLWMCNLIEFNGEEDHVHLLIAANPSLSLSKLISNLKSVSSRKVRVMHGNYLRKYYWKPFFWSVSYFLTSTGGASIDVIRKYIELQGNSSRD